MRKLLVLLISLSLIMSNLNAKAGSSVSRSSSGSYSSSSTSYGTKSNSVPASTQYSSTATRPTTSSSSTSSNPSSSASSSTASSSNMGAGTSSGVAGTSGNTYNRTTIVQNDQGGTGIGGTILGTMAGAAAGTMIGNSLSGNHGTNQGYAPAPQGQGYAGQYNQGQPQGYQGQPAQQGMASAAQTVQQPESWSILGFIWGSIVWLFKIALLALFFYGLYRAYVYFRKVYMIKKPEEREANLAKFGPLYTKIQRLYQANDAPSKKELAKVCTPEMYMYLTNIASENEEKGTTCITSDIEILNVTTKDWQEDEETGYIYHSAKIRVKFLDYVIDTAGEVIAGSNTEKIEDIEVWTFVSENAGKDWRLSAIEQYVK